jgi:hypothetical protein
MALHDKRPLYIDLASSTGCSDGEPAAAFSVHFGHHLPRNVAYLIDGSPTNNRAILLSLHCLLDSIHVKQPCIIYSASEYLRHSICHWAASNASRGWTCAHTDVLKALVTSIQNHKGTLIFRMRDSTALSESFITAKRMAHDVIRNGMSQSYSFKPSQGLGYNHFVRLPSRSL